MGSFKAEVSRVNALYSKSEKRNIAIYIAGIMLYKFGLEAFNGAVVTMATDRFRTNNAFGNLGILTGTNAAAQVVGSIIIAPLVRKFPTRTVLSAAIFFFAIMSSLILIIDAATGGKFKNMNGGKVKYGTWDINGLFPIYIISGVAYGCVELIRRVIPRDLVGAEPEKLRRLDAAVHVLYEVAGTAGAFASSAVIQKVGNNRNFVYTPICFVLASIVWRFIDAKSFNSDQQIAAQKQGGLAEAEKPKRSFWVSYPLAVLDGFRLFLLSIFRGAQLVTTKRRYVWLFFSYSVALYCHRYLENGLAPYYARIILRNSGLSQVFVAMSNLGELFGALGVFAFANKIRTPIPFLRLDALLLLIVWVLPYARLSGTPTQVAYKLGACFIPISLGWAAGDVSLAAYIQASLNHNEDENSTEVSSLGALFAFLYSAYIVIYAISSKLLGDYQDRVRARGGDPYKVLERIAGAHFTILAVIIFVSTFIPAGAFAFNPQAIVMAENDKLSVGDSEDDDDLKKDTESQEQDIPQGRNSTVAPPGTNDGANLDTAGVLAPAIFNNDHVRMP